MKGPLRFTVTEVVDAAFRRFNRWARLLCSKTRFVRGSQTVSMVSPSLCTSLLVFFATTHLCVRLAFCLYCGSAALGYSWLKSAKDEHG
jgi:hypothetical protein